MQPVNNFLPVILSMFIAIAMVACGKDRKARCYDQQLEEQEVLQRV